MIKTELVDGKGRGHRPYIESEGTLNVINHGHPPIGETLFAIPYRSRFQTSAGATDMVVDGSVTPVSFEINAINDRDIYLKSISALIGDGGSPALNKFGNLSALANGLEVCYVTQDNGEFVIHDGIKTNLEFIRLGVDTAGIGTGTDAYLADVSGGGTEKSYLPTIDLTETFGLPFGIKLRKGTKDTFLFKVNDDLSTLTTFNIIGYGIQI